MEFIETPIFTKQFLSDLTDHDLRQLQIALLFKPDAGDIIRGSGGLRKIRWSLPGKGKRGGIRVIYYWDMPDQIYLLFSYKKSKKEDLTKEQIKLLSNLMEDYLK